MASLCVGSPCRTSYVSISVLISCQVKLYCLRRLLQRHEVLRASSCMRLFVRECKYCCLSSAVMSAIFLKRRFGSHIPQGQHQGARRQASPPRTSPSQSMHMQSAQRGPRNQGYLSSRPHLHGAKQLKSASPTTKRTKLTFPFSISPFLILAAANG